MQVVENWGVLHGRLVRVGADQAAGAVPGHVAFVVDVARSDDVSGFPNLLRATPGTQVVVQVPAEAARRSGLEVGRGLSLRVRRAGPDRLFAHPDVEPLVH